MSSYDARPKARSSSNPTVCMFQRVWIGWPQSKWGSLRISEESIFTNYKVLKICKRRKWIFSVRRQMAGHPMVRGDVLQFRLLVRADTHDLLTPRMKPAAAWRI